MTEARSRAELLDLLREQLTFLESSNRAFDDGYIAEAKRIALALRILFHDTRRQRSVMKQLGLIDVRLWRDTAGCVDPANLLPTSGLTSFDFDQGTVTHAPTFNGGSPQILAHDGRRIARHSAIPFPNWWTNPVIKDADGRLFSRKNLVLAVADKEGGAHVDATPDADYDALANSGSLGWVLTTTGNVSYAWLANPVFPSLRQIAYEVLESISHDPII